MPPRKQPDVDPVLADAVLRAYVRPVDADTAKGHVSAIVAAADVGGDAAVRRPRRVRRAWPATAGALAATLLLPVGLAVAGVSLPEAVKEPYGAVGITLPHQARQPARQPAPALAPATIPRSAAPSSTTTRGQSPDARRTSDPRRGRRHPHPSPGHAGPPGSPSGSSTSPSSGTHPPPSANAPGANGASGQQRRPDARRRNPGSPAASVGAKRRKPAATTSAHPQHPATRPSAKPAKAPSPRGHAPTATPGEGPKG